MIAHSIARRIGFMLAALVVLAVHASDGPPLPYEAPGTHLGVVNCANSLCHGSVIQWRDANVLQNEYLTWSRVDKHHLKAFQVLSNATSKRIAKNLGLKQPPWEAKICIDCHAHNPPPEKRGERFKFSDYISCEACHGPAEGWIKTHVEPNATHAKNVENGLFPTSDPVQQARLCMSCHFGNKDKFVTHRIMGAGHPRISFEVDTFTQTAPPHFKVDKDYEERKGAYDPVRLWAIGQGIAARELLDVLLDPKRGRDGLFPELVVFDCHACHHPMSEARWIPRQGIGPGKIRLNDSNLLMFRQIVRTALPSMAASFNDQVTQLHRSVAGEGGGDPLEEARKLRTQISGAIERLRTYSFSDKDLRGILNGLIEDGLNGQHNDYSGAEQATMAIGSVLNYMVKRGMLENATAANDALTGLHRTVANDERYQPQRFVAALSNLKNRVAR